MCETERVREMERVRETEKLLLFSCVILTRVVPCVLQLTVKALQVCPESGLGGPECCLRVSLLPLRLNIDQVSLHDKTEKVCEKSQLKKTLSCDKWLCTVKI